MVDMFEVIDGVHANPMMNGTAPRLFTDLWHTKVATRSNLILSCDHICANVFDLMNCLHDVAQFLAIMLVHIYCVFFAPKAR